MISEHCDSFPFIKAPPGASRPSTDMLMLELVVEHMR